MARASRIEEIPLLKKEYETLSVEDRALWDTMEDERIVQMKKDRELSLKTRDRLVRMTKEKDDFINNLKASRLNIYKVRVEQKYVTFVGHLGFLFC